MIPPTPRINLVGVAQFLRKTFSLQRKKEAATLQAPLQIAPLGASIASMVVAPKAKLVVKLYNPTSGTLISSTEKWVTLAGQTAWEEISIGISPTQAVKVEAYITNEDTDVSFNVWFDELKIEVAAKPTAMVVQENHYSPFGLNMKGLDYVQTPTKESKFTFNGKEKQTELGLNQYDFGARGFDYQILRTTTLDPHADRYHSMSGYSFLNNNPLRFIDPTGMDMEHTATGTTYTGVEAQNAFAELQNQHNSRDDKGNTPLGKTYDEITGEVIHDDGESDGKVYMGSKADGSDRQFIGLRNEIPDKTAEFNKFITNANDHFSKQLAFINQLSLRPFSEFVLKNAVFAMETTDGAPYDIKNRKGSGFHRGDFGKTGYGFYSGKLLRFDDFGNFAFGVAAKAFGFSSNWAEFGAGLNQLSKALDINIESNINTFSTIDVTIRRGGIIGGISTYFDEKRDNHWIRQGYSIK